jgi:hydrogenase maturation protease
MSTTTLLLCIGNTLRSDDGAAHALGHLLAKLQIPDLHILHAHQLLPEHAVDAADARAVVIADASLASDAVCIELLPPAGARIEGAPPSTMDAHAMLPQDLAAMCVLMGGTDTSFHLLHIPARDFAHGEQLTPVVVEHVRTAAELLVRFLACPPTARVHRFA